MGLLATCPRTPSPGRRYMSSRTANLSARRSGCCAQYIQKSVALASAPSRTQHVKRSIRFCETMPARHPWYLLQHRLQGAPDDSEGGQSCIVARRVRLSCQTGGDVKQKGQFARIGTLCQLTHRSQHEARVLNVLLDAHEEGDCFASIEESTRSPDTRLSRRLRQIHSHSSNQTHRWS